MSQYIIYDVFRQPPPKEYKNAVQNLKLAVHSSQYTRDTKRETREREFPPWPGEAQAGS